MFNMTGSEIVVILLVALVVLGPEKLPDAIRRFGRAYAEFKRMSSGFQTEFRSVLEEPVREMRDTADMLGRATEFKPANLEEPTESSTSGSSGSSGSPASSDKSGKSGTSDTPGSSDTSDTSDSPGPSDTSDTSDSPGPSDTSGPTDPLGSTDVPGAPPTPPPTPPPGGDARHDRAEASERADTGRDPGPT